MIWNRIPCHRLFSCSHNCEHTSLGHCHPGHLQYCASSGPRVVRRTTGPAKRALQWPPSKSPPSCSFPRPRGHVHRTPGAGSRYYPTTNAGEMSLPVLPGTGGAEAITRERTASHTPRKGPRQPRTSIPGAQPPWAKCLCKVPGTIRPPPKHGVGWTVLKHCPGPNQGVRLPVTPALT